MNYYGSYYEQLMSCAIRSNDGASMSDKDVRWLQRFANYQKALIQLDNAVRLSKERELSRLEGQGLVQGFEFTHELAWNTLKDFLQYKGNNEDLYGSRDATRQAFKLG